MSRVGIGLPLVALKAKPLISLCQNLMHTHAEMALLVVEGAYIQHNRALLVKYARQEQCSHLFFMDHDMGFPADTIDRLLAHDKDIVGGAYNMRGVSPPQTTVMAYDDGGNRLTGAQLPPTLFRADAIACGVMLVKLGVFDALAWPWFDIVVEPEGCELTVSEDAWFCQQARKAGYDIWCDPTIPVAHFGEAAY